MKSDIVIAGVGGQGILTIAAVIGHAAVAEGRNVKQSEVHGMAQRGGAVVAHLRLSSNAIYSDLIGFGRADVLLAVEPLEAMRHLGTLGPEAVVVANTVPVENIPNYPNVDTVLTGLRALPHNILLDANAMAREAGSARAMNMAMLGAVSPFLALDVDTVRDTIRQAFERKGEAVVATNLAAFEAGRAAAEMS